MPSYPYDVFYNGKCIDTVFYCSTDEADEVKRGLINHDGYHPNITVRESKKQDYMPGKQTKRLRGQ